MGRIRIKRVYDTPSPDDGVRILVDRLWPRGLSKERACVDAWLPDAAPSTRLRQWFGHDPSRWAEFKRRYGAEIRANPGGIEPIRARAREQDVTLVFGAKDQEHNNAVVMAEVLGSRQTPGRSRRVARPAAGKSPRPRSVKPARAKPARAKPKPRRRRK